ncbi:alpha-2-macroglobulin-like [Embiotoca jacksoni]|uniref:alpha-2-macroglobulin-like n=1 Tax=Embiotoca jacksoni TaxID=100190 RepID=UPI003703ADF1
MGLSGSQTWTLVFCLIWMLVGRLLAKPLYMVTIPAVLEAGAQTKFCTSLLQANKILVMTVSLVSKNKKTILLQETSDTQFHTCTEFQVPLVQDEEVQKFEVEVRGDTFYSKEVRKVMIRVYRPMAFIQTDKPIYLPGQTVHFRVVTLDSKLRPAHQLYNIIAIEDAKNNWIGQWLNETSSSKILQLSHPLNSEAHEGTYSVIVSIDGKKTLHSFKVEKYVLPKFDVKIDAFDEISIELDEIIANVCANYTYRQPVLGSAELEICRVGHSAFRGNSSSRCKIKTVQMNNNGCATFTFEMSTFTKLNYRTHEDQLLLRAKVKEHGTGISHSQEKAVKISHFVGKLSFIETPEIYDPGSNVEGKVKAVHYNNTPIHDMEIQLLVRQQWGAGLSHTITTDRDGVAAFSLSTSNFHGDVRLRGKLASSLMLKRRVERLRCDTEETIFIQYIITRDRRGSMDIMYLVLSRGTIIFHGFKTVDVANREVKKGEVSFQLRVSPEMAPEVQVVAYAILPSENMISHSADFTTEKCFSHQVGLEFLPSLVVPGEDTTMKLTAQPNSLCGVNIVDQSVLIKEPQNTLTADKIFDVLPVKKLSGVPREVQDPETLFNNFGLKMATNWLLPRETITDDRRMISSYPRNSFLVTKSLTTNTIEKPIETIRSFFPETWIWDLVETGASGTKDVSLTVPDTITTWETEIFCLSPQGFGLAPREKLTVFQPFFLELTLPYSIIRGEQFELKATTFNYLTSCIMVTVTPAPSSDYTLTPLSGDQYTSCLCGNERKTLSWTMTPTAVGVVNVSVRAEAVASHTLCDNEIVSVPDRGRIDVVTRAVLVKAEGTEMTKTNNWLLCPKGAALTEEAELQLPENVINGSARASVSVLGEILGRALKNFDGLLRMPYGCGEQNIALLAPNIYILQFLDNTQQLTSAIKERAYSFLTSGYQRQLNYKDGDGAYSTFGAGPGNTWLTAFVLRSFVKAQSFVYIDPTKIEQSKTWLIGKQQQNGCFQLSGKLFHNRMKGGVSDEVTLSAYITAAFLEMNVSASNPVLRRSLSCLKESIGNFGNTYTTALLAYVFTLAGDMETRAQLLQHLDTVAIRQGSFLYWSQTAKEPSASLSAEISSYVMMAKLSASPTAEDLSYTTGIVRWLTGQQNSYGGFSSTQDTVVALQALSLYSTLVFSPTGSSTVKVQSPSGQLTFEVNQDNKLLYQETMLPAVTGKYSLEVTGTTCASVQISFHYNIPTPADVTTLSVEVDPVVNCSFTSERPRLTLNLRSLYSGEENSTNMVILDIKVLSGFVPDSESLKTLKGAPQVDRVEQKEDHVLVYLRELPQGLVIPHRLVLVQELPVQNLKPAVVKIYDYYQPSDHAETEYIYTCAAVSH